MRDSSIGQRLGLLGAVSAVAGLLLAGILLPAVGGLALAARAAVNDFERLPTVLKIPPLPQGSRLLAANGAPIATFYYQNRVPVTLAEVAPVMRQAIIDIEDSRFYEHHGIDFKGTLRALVTNARSGVVRQGGSTLTQQYVKQVLLADAQTPAQLAEATADTLARKMREARYAIALEHHMSKDQILQGYLNIAYFGDGAYGVGAAALHYFGVPASRLTLPEAALLAGLVQDPSLYDPVLHPVHGRTRRDVVIRRMAQLGTITPAQEQAALIAPLGLHVTRVSNGCEGTIAPFFCDYVLADIKQDPALGATPDERVARLLRGGLTIVTTLQVRAQHSAQSAVDTTVGRTSRFGAAVAMIEPGTGNISAIAENRTYGSGKGETRVDYAADYSHGGNLGMQAGSTFKIFTLAAALKEGIPLGLTLFAPPHITLSGFSNCAGQPLGVWSLGNAEAAEGGTFNIPRATWDSVNTFYAQLELRTGVCTPVQIATAMGVRQANGQPLYSVPAFTLGVESVSPMDMANAVATLAAHGKYCAPRSILRVFDNQRHELPTPPPACRQVLDPGLADTETQVLTGVIQHGTGTGAQIGRPAAGKTGTVDGFADAWFVGYTPNLAAAVAIGDPRGPQNDPLVNVTIGGQFYPQVFGGTIPAMIWQRTMSATLAGTPVLNFAPPSTKYEFGKTTVVPDVGGLPPAQALTVLKAAGFSARIVRGAVDSTQPKGTVAYTVPAAGSQVPQSTVIAVFISNGKPPPPSPTPTPTQSPTTNPTASPTLSPAPSPTPKRHHP